VPSESGWQRTPPRPRLAACAPGASIRPIQAQGWAGRPAPELNQFPARFQGEIVTQQGSQLGAPEHHIAPGQERVKRPDTELGGHLLGGLDGDQGGGRVHVRGLAEEPVGGQGCSFRRSWPCGPGSGL
jgi:hypothetical protein